MKKGQAATEFLMTYGWAIMAVIIVIGALAYFGVFSSNKFITGNAIVSVPFYADEWNVRSGLGTDGGINLELRNGGEDYNVYSIRVSNCGTADLTTHPKYNVLNGNVPMPSNAIENFQILCNPGTNLIEDKTFKGNIEITYRKKSSSLNLISKGTITEKIGA